MSAPIDHKKPTLAFVLLFVIASAVIGNALHARAAEPRVSYEAGTTIAARRPVTAGHGAGPSSAGGAAAALAQAFGTSSADGRTVLAGARPATRGGAHGHGRGRGRAARDGEGPLGHEGTSVGGAFGHRVPQVAVVPEPLVQGRAGNAPVGRIRLHGVRGTLTLTRSGHGLRVRVGHRVRIVVPLLGARD